MIKVGQIRSFINLELPNIKINHYNEETKLWFCIFQEDFKWPYISLLPEQIEIDTIII